jgi:hypothetical protein
METECLFPCSQQLVICSYPVRDQFIPGLHATTGTFDDYKYLWENSSSPAIYLQSFWRNNAIIQHLF